MKSQFGTGDHSFTWVFLIFPRSLYSPYFYIENNNYIIDTGNAFENDFGMTGVDLDNVDFIDDGDNYDDPEATEQPSNSDKRNSSNTELDFEYTQDVD